MQTTKQKKKKKKGIFIKYQNWAFRAKVLSKSIKKNDFQIQYRQIWGINAGSNDSSNSSDLLKEQE